MNAWRRSGSILLLLALAQLPVLSALAQAIPDSSHLIIGGYDPVAYFSEKRPIEGQPSINFDWDEGRYLFSSAEHRQQFAANPDRYAPQFAGHCAAGIAKGVKVKADPKIWRIVDGKLYVFSSALAGEEDYRRAVAAAREKWATIR